MIFMVDLFGNPFVVNKKTLTEIFDTVGIILILYDLPENWCLKLWYLQK